MSRAMIILEEIGTTVMARGAMKKMLLIEG